MNKQKTDSEFEPQNAIRGFIVEFLGSLVPGVAFLLAAIPAFVIPVATVAFTFLARPSGPMPVLTGPLPTSVGTVLFLVIPALLAFLVFAYIVGHLFYRQDPKIADRASFLRIPRHEGLDGMVRTVEGGGTPVEFPYHFLKLYLLDRGLTYLADLVPWDPSNFKHRCKHFANALKIRIHMESPQAVALLARNEAHVRLSSSTWYVCRTLMCASAVGLLVFVVATVVSGLAPNLPALKFSSVAVFPFTIFVVSWVTKWAIERVLHYQREREILFILETAHWLYVTDRVPKMFQGFERQKDDTTTA